MNGNRTNTNLIQHESSLFSSSLSEIFSRKHKISSLCILSLYVLDMFDLLLSHFLKEDTLLDLMLDVQLLRNDAPTLLPSFKAGSDHEEEPLESLEEIEVQAIGNLLPDGDDLFSGVMGLDTPANRADELEDFDLFSSGASNGSIVGGHPSRTLFMRNINSNVEDSELKALFEQYGDIHTLYTACQHRGFATISYYDRRAAQNAKRALQNKPLRHRKLDIHHSIPKGNTSEKYVNQGMLVVFNLDASVSTNGLQQIFGVFGEIKVSMWSNGFLRCDIAGKQIEIEPSPPGGGDESYTLFSCSGPGCGKFFDDLTARCVAGVSASGYMDNGSSPILQDVIRSPVNTFIGPSQSSSVLINLPSPARVASVNNQFNLREPNHTLDGIKFQNQCITSFHPQSFPEYHNNLAKSLPSNSSSTIPDMVSSFVSQMTYGLDNRSIHGVSTNGHLIEPNEGAVCFMEIIMRGTTPTHISSTLQGTACYAECSITIPHHIGSAPSVNSPLRTGDRRHAYAGKSPDTSSFHLGSLGNVGFPGSSPSHTVEIASHNIFSHAGGNNGVVYSPQQMCHLFPGRNPVISMPGSFESPNERVRNFLHHRNELNFNNADKKQYELDIDCIIDGEDSRTTLMIKNIPNKYTSKMLLAAINEHCQGSYDFIYLPIDFKNKCNVGYAFINMIDPQQIIPFHKAFNGKKWEKFNSEKAALLAYARIQEKAALIAHFQNSSLMNEDKQCRPIFFSY
ncbi:hypothetical protein SLEP1_g52623 [Rubroshorea leprosula]|uniref:RRM domain-containing protein n=1 Tax=Rubroshorea leprosula TaxID=152421 RepID=A0AAV5M8L4_9ROSI|nr:hypothetical protein SLEP1_g52623 [Rubroshorea leprosula]